MIAAVGVVTGLAGLAALPLGWSVAGLSAVIVALAVFALADVLAWLRDERRLIAAIAWFGPVSVALAVLLYGRQAGLDAGADTAPLLALGVTVAGGLAERAAGAVPRRLWWATLPVYPLILLPAAIAGQPATGLAAAAAYAVATLTHAVEQLRVRIAR